jgi:mannose-6-phosphate isomerase-like protein (cupin superfamily)
MPPWIIPGPFPGDFSAEERCQITELLNDTACPEVSLAIARVAPGVTTRLHAVQDTVERYVVRRGEGMMEVGGVQAPVRPGDRVLIAAGIPQRITNTGREDLEFYEVCTPRFRQEAYRDLEP